MDLNRRRKNADVAWIKTNVPIQEIARRLGLQVSGNLARCWRPENHANGDRDPSVRFNRRKNRGCCFVCDVAGGWSNLDLVMMVMACDFPSAIAWICEEFPVPAAPRGKHISSRQAWNPTHRVGFGNRLFEWLVRSGLWAELTPPQRSILVVLDTFTDSDTRDACISYRGLARYAGVGSHTTIRRSLRRFQQIGLLEIERGVGTEGFRSVSRYKLTPESSSFLSLVNGIYERQRKEIERERDFRAEQRKLARRHKKPFLPVKDNPLSTQWSTGNFDATPRVDREVQLA